MCTSPLFAYRSKYLFAVDDGELLYSYDRFGRKLKFLKDCDRSKFDLLKQSNDEYGDYIEIPCGNCMQCRLNKSREWATRITTEQMTSKNAIFLTLTYDDEHLPMGTKGLPTLIHKHLSDFMDNLRAYCQYHYDWSGIRFYGAGEYGDTTARPHYHVCVFNLPDDLLSQNKFYKASFQGDLYWNNPVIDKIWKKGYCVIGELNWQSAAYVARYVTKKLTGKWNLDYARAGIFPEFARMSRRPGIGGLFYELHKDDIFKYDKVFVPIKGGQSVPSYFDKKFALEDPIAMEVLKGQRQMSAQLAIDNKLSRTDRDLEQLLKDDDEVLRSRLKKLLRPL